MDLLTWSSRLWIFGQQGALQMCYTYLRKKVKTWI